MELALNIGRRSVGRDYEGRKTVISGRCYFLRQIWEMSKLCISDVGLGGDGQWEGDKGGVFLN